MNGIITSNAMHGQVGTAINNEINNSHNTVIVGLKTVYDLMGTEFLQTISDFQGSVGETSETAILNEDTLNATKTKITNAGTSQTEYETSFNQIYDSINDLISLSSPSSIVSTYLSSTSKILQEVIDKVNSFENTATEIKVDNMLQVLSQQTEVGKQAQDLSYTDPQFVEFASYSQLSEKVQEIDKELTEAKEKAKKEAEEAEKKAREEWKRNHPVTAWLQDTSANIGAWWEGVKQGTKDIDIPFVRDTLLFAEGFIGQAGSTLSGVSIMASEFIELVPELGIVLGSRITGFEAPEWVEKDVSGTLDNAYSAGKYMYRFFTDGETRNQAWESLKKSAGDAWNKFLEDPAYNAGGAFFEVASFLFGIGEVKAALTAAKGAETFLEGAKLFLKAAKNEAVQNGDNFIRNLKRLYHKKDDLARILAEGGSNSLDNLLRMRDNIGEFLSKHPLASMFGEEFSFAGVGRYFGGYYGDDFGRHTARVYNMADEVERGASRVSSKFSSEAFEGGVETGKGLADDIILRDGSHFDDFGNLKPNVRYQAGEFARSLDGSVDEILSNASEELSNLRRKWKVPETDTIAVGKTTVPGLEGKVFEGGSPKVRKEAGLSDLDEVFPDREIQSPRKNALFTRHAEEDVIQNFIKSAEELGLPNDKIEGVFRLHQSNPSGVCGACKQGLTNPDVSPGILKQFSEKYPNLIIEVTTESAEISSKLNFIIKNGQIL